MQGEIDNLNLTSEVEVEVQDAGALVWHLVAVNIYAFLRIVMVGHNTEKATLTYIYRHGTTASKLNPLCLIR